MVVFCLFCVSATVAVYLPARRLLPLARATATLLPGRMRVALIEPFLVPVGPFRRTVPVTGETVLPVLRTASVSVFLEPLPTIFAAPALRL
jgi:hypothetical protein